MDTKNNQLSNIRKLQGDLLQISETGRAAINVTQYENLGLVRTINKHCKDASGNDQTRFDRLVLTKKGKQILGTVL